MPIKKSSVKDVRRTKARRERNVAVISRLRSAIRGVNEAKTPEEAQKAYQVAEKLLDKAAVRGYVHARMAARKKSRLAVQISKIKKP